MLREAMIQSVVTRLKDRDYRIMEPEDYGDHVDAAVLEYSGHRARIRRGTLTLTAGVAVYAAPADFVSALSVEWGNERANDSPWDVTVRLARVPRISRIDENLALDPAPSAAQIAVWGSGFGYTYRARHALTDTATTIPEQDALLVRLAALASACKQIAADATQSEAFVKRYTALARRYREQFMDLIGTPRPILMRS